MKNLTLLGLLLTFLLMACKKGENDPFISFRSRDTRLEGEWTLTKSSLITSGTYSDNTSYSYTTSFDGQNMNRNDISGNEIYPYQMTLKIDKIGTYTITEISTIGSASTETVVTKGNWSWLNKGKNKVGIQLDYIGRFQNADNEYYIDMLKNKEMTWLQSSEYISPIPGHSQKSDMTMTFEQK